MQVDHPGNRSVWEKIWNIKQAGLSLKKGLTTTEILFNVKPGGIRSLYIMGENPMMSEPNLNLTHHHMQRLEFLVAQDLFINESGAFADVFLPAVSWAEKDGTFTNTDRRVQRIRQALPALGRSRPDWEIICDLAERIESRLQHSPSSGWTYQHPSQILREVSSAVPEYAGVNYDRIENTGLQTPVWDQIHPGTPYLFAKEFPRGKGRFHPLEFIPSVEQPDDEYTFILSTGRVLEHWHGGTMTRNSELNQLYPQAYVLVNQVDAELIGGNKGQAVRVTSRRGSVVLRIEITDKTPAGVVFIPFHFSEAAANLLTIDALDPLAKIPEFKACAVKIEPADENDLPIQAEPVQRGRH
jgi:predicted molibdopterin-dependent oxidoreductase YjgC